MKRKTKQQRSGRATKREMPAAVFVVPSHGRLVRRGSTEVVEEGHDESRGRHGDRGQAA